MEHKFVGEGICYLLFVKKLQILQTCRYLLYTCMLLVSLVKGLKQEIKFQINRRSKISAPHHDMNHFQNTLQITSKTSMAYFLSFSKTFSEAARYKFNFGEMRYWRRKETFSGIGKESASFDLFYVIKTLIFLLLDIFEMS